jgi:coenzyme F420-reducing hydrogenase alpha subunit
LDPEITHRDVRVAVGRKEGEGVGVVEAPRGTLIHHYKCNENGFVTMANLIVPTTHNNMAINNAALEAARKYVKNGIVDANAAFRIESAIRTFDPCLSCATHAQGRVGGITIELRRNK